THGMGFLDDAAKSVEVEFVKLAWGDMRVRADAAVPTAFGDAIDGKMFECGGDALALDTQGHLFSEFGDDKGIFAVAFERSAPAGVAGEVEDGGIDIGIAEGFCFAAYDLAGFADEGFIPGRADGDGSRQGGGTVVVEAVDAFISEVHGDAQAGLFDEPALDGIDGFGVAAKGIGILGIGAGSARNSVEVFVDISDAVLPDLLFPFRCGQLIFEHAAEAV